MKQKVHSVSYLAKAEFELKNGVYDLVALPCGAEVVKATLEVVGNPTAGNIYIGFKDATDIQKNHLFVLENVETNKNATSAKDYTATSNKVIAAEVKNANGNTNCVLRVLYFLPSVIEVEY
ncbi:hypothetical protein FIM55_01560 [Helicobacter pylori]|uniref:hypothetical protein n=1 Tax=Helicobacter pylori TaxID=210 RepID=UPI00112E3244|nr:hypothetical protein [Helicobacter pylori]TPH80086.1 hypothetical protein FIM55_01560 [Helicobacter pylori]